MFSTLSAILLAVTLVFGGGGITVASAQGSQPDQLLYGIKLLTEDIRLDLTTDPQTQYQITMDFITRRADEIRLMLEEGNVPPESVLTRYQNQVEQAIRFASNLPEDQEIQALEQIRELLQTQEKTMLQIRGTSFPNANGVFLQSQQMIQDRLRLLEQKQTDPAQLQEQDQTQIREQLQEQDQLRTSMPEEQATRLESENGNFSPWATEEPTQNSGYGSTPESKGTCTPVSGESGGQQATQQPEQQPESGKQSTTMPGSKGAK